jgi:hypothetical protein
MANAVGNPDPFVYLANQHLQPKPRQDEPAPPPAVPQYKTRSPSIIQAQFMTAQAREAQGVSVTPSSQTLHAELKKAVAERYETDASKKGKEPPFGHAIM